MIQKSIALLLIAVASVHAADWPAFKRDAARSSISDESIEFPLVPSWKWTSPQRPNPAWGDPGRSLNPLDFDYAFQPVIASGIVVFGSSADDTVRAHDATTGKPLWQFICGAPVRLAPQLEGGRCYFASDDGSAYCIDLRTGRVVWKKRLALNGESVIANGRIASRWPCRSGILVRDGVVYATAGMWPSEGVFIFALNAETGAEIWCNDTSCYDYIEYPHVPSASFGGPAPQGPLLANDEVLLVPTGRGVPAAYDRKTGRLIHYRADSGVGHKGGTWATLANGTVFVTAVGWQPDIPPRLGESVEHFADSLAAFTATTGVEEWKAGASLKSVAPEWKSPRWRGQIAAGLLGRTRAVIHGDCVFAYGNGKADAWELGAAEPKSAWSIEHPRIYAEALAANALFTGQAGRVGALDRRSGAELWAAPVDGTARGIAIADGRVFVATSTGTLHVFGKNEAPLIATSASNKWPAHSLPPTVEAALKALPATSGFAAVFGGNDARLAESLAARTNLHVAAVLRDTASVDRERSRLVAETSVYGSRISVHSATDVIFPDYFATLVVIDGDAAGVPQSDYGRVLRPYGGVMCSASGPLAPAAYIPDSVVRDGLIVRGGLKGAFDWDGKVPADERVKWPLKFSWWGGPSSQLQKARHTRPRTPLAAAGRLFIFGENTVSAIDAYTGTELWSRRLNASVGMDGPALATADSFYATAAAGVARFDAATGRLVGRFGEAGPLQPVLDATKPLHIDGTHRVGASCAMDIESTPQLLRITLKAENKDAQRDDAWELGFDFRSAEARLNAPGPGTFQLIVGAHDGIARSHPTFPHPAPRIEKLADGRIALVFSWDEIERFAGWRPTEFALAADCKLWGPKLDLVLWDKPLTNGRMKSFHDSEAIIVVSRDATPPAVNVPVRPLAESPLKPARGETGPLPLLSQRRPKADLSDFSAAGIAQEKADESKLTRLPRARGFEFAMREEPFTGESGTLDYTPSYGCSGIISSAVMDFMRSGTIGMYDRRDDSGMRNISGIRSGCGQTIVPALGMLLYAEGTGNCLCTYNYATSFGMAPAPKQRNEDWAMFDDTQPGTSGLRHIAFNLGAPGDRRDESGTLWLALPRPPLAVKMGNALTVPALIDSTGGSERINTDRRSIAGTDKPWLYGSHVAGLQRFHLDLQYYEPGNQCLSIAASTPTIDGTLADPCWDGFGAVHVRKDATLWMRHDAENLYIATRAQPGAKALPFTITFGDPGGRKLVNISLAGGRTTAARIDVPEFDRKADVRTLPEVTPTAPSIAGIRTAVKDVTEIAIPWASLADAGLDREKLVASPNALAFYGRKAPDIVRNFTRTAFAIRTLAATPPPANYTVRLHFAELGAAKPGERVFDIALNGKVLAAGFDLVRESGGPMRAVVREFKSVPCGAALDIELRGHSAAPPLLSAVEVLRDDAVK
jgi:outer membrane protein assembly factor BamB